MSSSWFDDDDWEMLWNDDGILYGQEMNAQPVYKRDWNDHKIVHQVCVAWYLARMGIMEGGVRAACLAAACMWRGACG